MSERQPEAIVRPARLDDADAISRLSAASWREGFRDILPPALREPPVEVLREWLHDRLRDPAAGVFVGVVEGEVRGYLGCGPSRDRGEEPRTGEIYALYVDPCSWRRGIGRSLIEVGLRHLRSDGFHVATLWTFAGSAAAKLYESQGFAPDGATQRRPQFGEVLEMRYRRPLRSRASV